MIIAQTKCIYYKETPPTKTPFASSVSSAIQITNESATKNQKTENYMKHT